MKRYFGRNSFYFGVIASFLLISTAAFSKDHKFQGSIPLKGIPKREYATLAKLTIQEAMTKANQAVPGKIIEIVLEEEEGFLIYEAEVVRADQSHDEVIIDAGSGAVLLVKAKKH